MPASVRRLFPHHFGLTTKRAVEYQGVDLRALLTLTGTMVVLAVVVFVDLVPLMQVRPLGYGGWDVGFRIWVKGAGSS